MAKNKGIASAANAVPCSQWQLRRMEPKGIVKPARDEWGRRLFGEDDIAAARKHLASQGASENQAA